MGKVNSSSDSEQPAGSELAQPARFTSGSLGNLLEVLRRFDAADTSAPASDARPIEPKALPETARPESDDPAGP